MKIGQLASRAGVTVDTVRYYERRGLLPKPARTQKGYRAYAVADVERLSRIKFLRGLGISLDAITEMLRAFDRGQATCDNQAPVLEAAVDRIDRDIERLQRERETIVEVLSTCRSGNCTLQSNAPS